MNLTPFYSLFSFLSPFPFQFRLSSSYSFSLTPSYSDLLLFLLSLPFPFSLPFSSSTTPFLSFLSPLHPSPLLPPFLTKSYQP